MSVAEALRLTRPLVQELAVRRWPDWSSRLPVLGGVERPAELDRWLRQAAPADADDILLALAQLAALDGGDDPDAARLLAWVLLPGACRVATTFRRAEDIDEHVAAQLWIEIRSFSWQTTSRVAANILGRVRKHLARELTDPARPTPVPTQAPSPAASGIVSGLGRMYGLAVTPAPDDPSTRTPMEELLSVLEWGCGAGVISRQDRLLLLDVIAAAADQPAWLGAGGGLLGDGVSDAVGNLWGVSGRTVRRRAAASIEALSRCTRRPHSA